MFKRQREFNIITGTVANEHIVQRSKSCTTQIEKFNKIPPINLRTNRLGDPKDKKQFQYSYNNGSNPVYSVSRTANEISTQGAVMQKTNSIPNYTTMMNYVSTAYNIINHSNQIQTAKVANKHTFLKKIPELNKKSPLTEHLHRARLLAPNYHQDFKERTQKFEFYKKGGFCANICDIQKTYGQGRYFRKFK